ncbi:MAG: TonB-dependent receptor, partial [Bacteroidetes bacterium]|nr:TonB-dependent receptor [Bacteroidota bacterium]
MQLKKPLLPLLAAILLLNPLFSSAQNFTLSGTIKDAKNGEDLIGAIAVVKENTSKGTVTNTYGFYSLTLPAGKYTIIYQFIGYNMQEVAINLDKNISKNIQLAPSANETKTVEIHGERKDKNIQNTQMSVVTITPKEIENIPVLFGEKDVMKTLQLTPGVKSAGEGNAGFYVRGGGTDQNLILLDEAPVYNASHLLGFFSVFNSDALKEVTLYKGGMPAEFGGRASSVMDVKMKDGNSKNYSLSGGIGLISSRLTLEGPIVKEKGSFIISARRTYADAFLVFSNDTNLRKASLYFYDLNLKANYQITEKDRIYLSGYFGQDVFGLAAFGFNWGNTTATLRWNHIINSQMFSNTSLIYSNYAYQIAVAFTGFSFKINSSIQDFNLKQDFSYFINPDNKMKFGFGLIHHTFRPTRLSGTGINFNDALINKYALEGGLYVQNDQRVTDLLSLQYGLRYSMFDYLGEGVAYTYDKDGNVTDSKSYKNGESIKYHGGFEPRLSAKYLLNEFSSVKASVGRN